VQVTAAAASTVRCVADRSRLADALLVAPVGVALLAVLEGEVRDGLPAWPWQVPTDSDPNAVRAAADAVSTRSFGSLLAAAVDAATIRVGPWISGAADTLALAYRHAADRAPIARAIDERFGVDLHAPLAVDAQQWWHSGRDTSFFTEPRFRAFDQVYGAGQFTWAGLWTVSDPPPEVHADLVSAWELDPDPVSRWHLPVRPGARVLEIHRPQDWTMLVATHPATGRSHPEWELPGLNQHPGELRELTAIPGQHASRTSIHRHLVPDWALVAADYDGVHLSWAGFLTTEGFVSDLGDGDVAMLRYWFSERTHWLTDAFGEPVPLGAPSFDPTRTSLSVCDVRTDDNRRRHDEAILTAQLGR
jgi:hypothetical protein